ncbi:hypothetical protein DAI22_12g092100 [Oryza sativa Japonica Group]|nr:hypothetical protein DAI22_12g092100 [Oryza sativa Japonica Group]
MCAVMYLPRSSSAIDLQQQPHLHRTVRHPHNPRHARPLCVPPCPHSAVQTPNQILLASPKCRSNAGCSTPQLSAGTGTGIKKRKKDWDRHFAQLSRRPLSSLTVPQRLGPFVVPFSCSLERMQAVR